MPSVKLKVVRVDSVAKSSLMVPTPVTNRLRVVTSSLNTSSFTKRSPPIYTSPTNVDSPWNVEGPPTMTSVRVATPVDSKSLVDKTPVRNPFTA